MNHGLGIDIGGTGIKGARVNLATGELLSERIKIATPLGAHPGDVFEVVGTIVDALNPVENESVGVCFPAVVTHGITRSASNVSKDWIGYPAEAELSRALGTPVILTNDADAAGVAEVRIGAAQNVPGLVILTTLGTGIGSAFLMDGVLVPHSELGILEIDGERAEIRAANSAREREDLSFEQWSRRLTRFFGHVEDLFSPELFIGGGRISRRHAEFSPLIDVDTPVRPAAFLNNAGIIGSALLAHDRAGGAISVLR